MEKDLLPCTKEKSHKKRKSLLEHRKKGKGMVPTKWGRVPKEVLVSVSGPKGKKKNSYCDWEGRKHLMGSDITRRGCKRESREKLVLIGEKAPPFS